MARIAHASTLRFEIPLKLRYDSIPMSNHDCFTWALSTSPRVGAVNTCCVWFPDVNSMEERILTAKWSHKLSRFACSQSPSKRAPVTASSLPGVSRSNFLRLGVAMLRKRILTRATKAVAPVQRARPARHPAKRGDLLAMVFDAVPIQDTSLEFTVVSFTRESSTPRSHCDGVSDLITVHQDWFSGGCIQTYKLRHGKLHGPQSLRHCASILGNRAVGSFTGLAV